MMTHISKHYLDSAVLDAIDPAAFRAQLPYPWINPQHVIAEDRFHELLDSLPDISQFRAFIRHERKHGQASHDRYILDYEKGMELSPAWSKFVKELRSRRYRRFICALLGVSNVRFRFHWHFSSDDCEVSPHCDSRNKIGSHIFYLNTVDDWDWDWGGETVILDDGGRHEPDNAPAFEEFDAEYPANTKDNRSLIFGRQGNSWHGVRRINCPENHYRKVFIVTFEKYRPRHMVKKRFRRLLAGTALVTDKERHMY
jgi:hypothetical protein